MKRKMIPYLSSMIFAFAIHFKVKTHAITLTKSLIFLAILFKSSLATSQNSYSDKNPVWSAGGKWIAFESDRNGNSDIYIVKPDGSELQQISTNEARDLHPSWSPDGSTIAFQSNRSGNWDLWTIGIENKKLLQLTRNSGANSFASWSPDGKYICFNSNRSGDSEIYLIKSDGTDIRRLTNSEGFDAMAKWHPGGKVIFFVSKRSGVRNIFKITLEDFEIAPVIESNATTLGPSISPDGMQMTYLQKDQKNVDLLLYTFESGGIIRIPNVKPGTCNWGPDRLIVYDKKVEDGYRIFIQGIDNKSIWPLIKE